MLYNLVVERTGKTGKLHNSVNFQKLIYHFMGHSKYIDFNDFIDTGTVFDDLKSKKIRFEDVEKTQTEFKSKLISALVGGNKSGEIENITKFYKSWEEVIKSYNDYFKMVHKSAYDSIHRKGLKILSPKQVQMF